MRTLRKAVSALLIVSSLTFARSVLSRSEAYGLERDISWNICGGQTCGNNGGTTVAFLAVVDAQYYAVQAMATQETCTDQRNYMSYEMLNRGYKFGHIVTNPTASDSCGAHGNSIFWKGSCEGTCVISTHYSVQHPDELPYANPRKDWRGFVCGIVGAGPFSQRCSTHMTSRGDSYAIDQTEQFRNHLRNAAAFGIAGSGKGDFNLEPGQFLNWQTLTPPNFDEADQGYNRSTTDNGNKIDYQYYTRANYCTFPPASQNQTFYSDHHVYIAYKNIGAC